MSWMHSQHTPSLQQQPQPASNPPGQHVQGMFTDNQTGSQFMANMMRPQSNEGATMYKTSQQQHGQGHINNQQQQIHNWQEQNTFNQNNIMKSTPTDNWQQQNIANANAPQQYSSALNMSNSGSNDWQHPSMQQQQKQQQLPTQTPGAMNQYFTTTPQQQYYQHNNTSFLQQSNQPTDTLVAPPSHQQQNISTTNVGSNDVKNDGWSDWDWNDNTSSEQRNSSNREQQQHDATSNIIEESFNSNGNDNWQWNMPEDKPHNLIENQATPFSEAPAAKVLPTDHLNNSQVPSQQIEDSKKVQEIFPDAVSNDTIKANSSALQQNVINKVDSSVVSSVPGPSENIPNSVYVSQAKPVARPPRQYASPPGGSTPPEDAENILPPFGFQNEMSRPEPSAMNQGQMPIVPPPAISSSPFLGNTTSTNPFKRTGTAQHHRADFLPSAMVTNVAPQPASQASFTMPPPPPADFANMLPVPLDERRNAVPDNSEVLHENQEVIVNSSLPSPTQTLNLEGVALQSPQLNEERNQYLQTSHLSETLGDDLNAEGDNLPPPGLSRLVLGEPELSDTQRMVTGTEEPSATVTNMTLEERHADGEDTSIEPTMTNIQVNVTSRSMLVNSNLSGNPVNPTSNIDMTTDRNLYLVTGESNLTNEQRVVTGVERAQSSIIGAPTQVMNEQREVMLDGENLEDQHSITVSSRNEPPLEGAASSAETTTTTTYAEPSASHNITKSKDLSNDSTGDDNNIEINNTRHKMRKHMDTDKKLDKQRKERKHSVDRYDSDEEIEDYSSDRERDRRRLYREGSVRSDRGRDDREHRERRRRDNLGERDKLRERYYREGARGDRRHYDGDAKYETEESIRNEISRKEHSRRSARNVPSDDRGGRSDRSDRDYDEYKRRTRANRDKTHAERERERARGYGDSERRERPHRRDRHEQEEVEALERRRRDRGNPKDYDEYRKHSSRNKRDSDTEKERARGSADPRYDPRHKAMYGYPSYGYDPYTYYYEQMARTNPQAYMEWYKKYYESTTAAAMSTSMGSHGASVGIGEPLVNSSLAAADGRESVHSGRSSAHNDRDRYTHAYISQANEYHRHFHYQQLHQQQQEQEHQQQQKVYNAYMNSGMLEQASSIYGSHTGHQIQFERTRSTSNLSQVHSTTSNTGANPSYYPIISSHAFYARSDYTDSRSGNISLRDVDASIPDQQRLTPCKFVNEHAIISLSAGVLVTVKPKFTHYGTINNIVKIQRLNINDSTRRLFQTFPGPLIRGLTHKKTIIEFCEEQIRLGSNDSTIFARQILPAHSTAKYRASFTLMWNLLILLLRQNGMVVGTDIAELLMKNQQQYPYKIYTNESISSNSGKNYPKSNNQSTDESGEDILKSDSEKDDAKESSTENNVACAESSQTITKTTITEEEITEKFRNYLLYGNVNEALDWAADNNLWGHALFLASKMDRRSHANTMLKFANKLSLNDPLQTLYQLMSGRTPSSVTSVQDEKWGDWRPHLSMILSNTSQKPELNRKAITTLGDSLFNRGDLYGAHFCYLMAQVSFGRYQETATQETTLQQNLPKLVLLGSSHYKPFRDFATNEAIMMTEIYEYACSLNNDNFSLVEFQPYKYLLATRMLDYGFNLKSLMYMEQIAVQIERDPSKFEPSFIHKVFELADRLKYYEPMLEKSSDEQIQGGDDNENIALAHFEDQQWLQNLRSIAAQYVLDPNASQTVGMPENNINLENQYNKQLQEINAKFDQLNIQYVDNNTDNGLYNPEQSNLAQQQRLQQQQLSNQEHLATVQQQLYQNASVDEYAVQQELQQQQQQQTNYNAYGNNNQNAYAQPSVEQQQNISYQPQMPQNSFYDPMQHHQNAAVTDAPAVGGSYDYWSGQHQQQQAIEENARPTISMPKSKTYESDDDTKKQKSQQYQAGKAGDGQSKKGSAQQQNKSDAKDSKSSQANQNSGWFGGIWGKLMMKPKNQMILPDDKNPTIVWDPERKRWVNTEGEDNTEETLKPPPKMADLIPTQHQAHQQQQQQQSQQQPMHMQQQQQSQMPAPSSDFSMPQYDAGSVVAPSGVNTFQTPLPTSANIATGVAYSAAATGNVPQQAGAENTTPKPPSLQSNMFKMQRNRTLKNSYVDVFNPSGAPMTKTADVLAPTLPPATVPQGGFFVPGAAGDAQQQQQGAPQDMPQFYNPNQFGAPGNNGGGY